MAVDIDGINVEIDHPDIKKAKSVEQLDRLEIFSSLGEGRKDANKKLWELLHPEKPKKEKSDEIKFD